MRYGLGAEELLELGAAYKGMTVRTPFLANRVRGQRSFGNWAPRENLSAVKMDASMGATQAQEWLPWAVIAAGVVLLLSV